jgi:hypothetical protein
MTLTRLNSSLTLSFTIPRCFALEHWPAVVPVRVIKNPR